jgi:hypothetical protein
MKSIPCLLPLNYGCTPIDGTDKLIYSNVEPSPPYSYGIPDNKYDPKCPPPTYFKYEELDSHEFTYDRSLKGFQITKNGNLKCVDKEVIEKQKGVVSDLIKQVLQNFFKLGSFNNHISLPARIFEPRSLVERILDLWKTAPVYLNKAAMISDLEERVKLVTVYMLSGAVGLFQQMKPFNPYTGETCEGTMEDGTKIYCEQTEHNPPTTHFMIFGAKGLYTVTGYYAVNLAFQTNMIEGRMDGTTTIVFNRSPRQKITYTLPKMMMGGFVFGDRTLHFEGLSTIEDKENRLRSFVFFNDKNAKANISGKLYKYKSGVAKAPPVSVNEIKDVEIEIATLEGNITKGGSFNSIPYWNQEKMKFTKITYEKFPLPSDWRYREDLIWLARGNIPFTDAWKKRLEERQRVDRKLRIEWAKKHSKDAKKEVTA